MKRIVMRMVAAVGFVAVTATAALAAHLDFGGYLVPGAAQSHIGGLSAGHRVEIKVKGMHDRSAFGLRVYQWNGASWTLIKEKVSDDEELQMRLTPAVSTNYRFQVRNVSGRESAYQLKVRDD